MKENTFHGLRASIREEAPSCAGNDLQIAARYPEVVWELARGKTG